jgi:hypothetical protein
MVLTNAQVTAFFTGANSMAIPAATVAKLSEEGINTPTDLRDFDKDTISAVADSLRRPNDRIPNPDPGAAPGATIPRPPYVFSALSQKRLLEAANLVRFYEIVGRELTPGNLRYDPVIRDFAAQWKALKSRKDDTLEVPKISKTLQILKWSEAFDDFLNRTIGTRNIPLAYVTRENVDPANPAPPLAPNRCYSTEHGSVEGELVARASHTHASFRDDNSKVYYFLEEATRSTSYAASIKPYQRTKDGRAAYASMRRQYAGRDKWEAELKHKDDLLHNQVWKGQSNFSLEKFIAQHRNAFVSMQQCADHVDFQLPNEYTRVGFLLNAIQCSDASLQAALANVSSDDGPGGKRHDFEATASYLLPYCPVAKKRNQSNNGKRNHGEINDVTAEISAADGFGTKPGIGKTGVHLRYHSTAEYSALDSDQRKELHDWRASQKKKGKGGKSNKAKVATASKSLTKKQVAAMIAAATKKKPDAEKDDDDLDALIMSLQSNAAEKEGGTPAKKKVRIEPPPTTTVNTSALQSILRRVKNDAKQE